MNFLNSSKPTNQEFISTCHSKGYSYLPCQCSVLLWSHYIIICISERCFKHLVSFKCTKPHARTSIFHVNLLLPWLWENTRADEPQWLLIDDGHSVYISADNTKVFPLQLQPNNNRKIEWTPPKPLITSHGLWARCLQPTWAIEVITSQQQIQNILHPYSKGMQMDSIILPIV